jgi:hypothetical protein
LGEGGLAEKLTIPGIFKCKAPSTPADVIVNLNDICIWAENQFQRVRRLVEMNKHKRAISLPLRRKGWGQEWDEFLNRSYADTASVNIACNVYEVCLSLKLF